MIYLCQIHRVSWSIVWEKKEQMMTWNIMIVKETIFFRSTRTTSPITALAFRISCLTRPTVTCSHFCHLCYNIIKTKPRTLACTAKKNTSYIRGQISIELEHLFILAQFSKIKQFDRHLVCETTKPLVDGINPSGIKKQKLWIIKDGVSETSIFIWLRLDRDIIDTLLHWQLPSEATKVAIDKIQILAS